MKLIRMKSLGPFAMVEVTIECECPGPKCQCGTMERELRAMEAAETPPKTETPNG